MVSLSISISLVCFFEALLKAVSAISFLFLMFRRLVSVGSRVSLRVRVLIISLTVQYFLELLFLPVLGLSLGSLTSFFLLALNSSQLTGVSPTSLHISRQLFSTSNSDSFLFCTCSTFSCYCTVIFSRISLCFWSSSYILAILQPSCFWFLRWSILSHFLFSVWRSFNSWLSVLSTVSLWVMVLLRVSASSTLVMLCLFFFRMILTSCSQFLRISLALPSSLSSCLSCFSFSVSTNLLF